MTTTTADDETSNRTKTSSQPRTLRVVDKGKSLVTKSKGMANKGKDLIVNKGKSILRDNKSSTIERNDGLATRASCEWNVKISFAKKHTIKGKMVPGIRGTFNMFASQDARIRIEIRTPKQEGSDVEETELVLSPRQELMEGDRVVIRVLKHVSAYTYTSKTIEEGENGDNDNDTKEENEMTDWRELRKVTLEGVLILRTFYKYCEIKLGRGNDATVHTITFDSEDDTDRFCALIEDLRDLEKARAQRQLEAFQVSYKEKQKGNLILKGEIRTLGEEDSSFGVAQGDKLKLLIEIVSAQNLPYAGALGMTDTCVVLRLGTTEFHCTETIPDTQDPIWTVKTGSLYLLETTAEEFFTTDRSGVTFLVMDWPLTAPRVVLGRVRVSSKDLASGTGERTEHLIHLEPQYQVDENGKPLESKLVLRYRLATQKDVEFMEYLAVTKEKRIIGKRDRAKKIAEKSENSFVPAQVVKKKPFQRETRRKKGGPLEVRIKPGPDPERPRETTWMTKGALDKNSLDRSQHWISAGSGKIGKIFFELIRCRSLPNMDTFSVTDAVAVLVYEDICVNTSVINDSLNPRWPSWSQRAFIFHVSHPSSQLNLAIFDYDYNVTAADAIGRVSIDITNLNPDTVYTLDYKLYTTARVTRNASEDLGSVTVRLRVEWHNPREVVMASLKPSLQYYVNVRKQSDFQTAYYTCFGMPNVNAFSMDTIWSYIEEVESYKEILYYVGEAAKTVIFWRGHFPVMFRKRVLVRLPIHSVVAFVGALLLIEDYEKLPSFLLFAVAWFFFSTMLYRQHHPSPWTNCVTYWDVLQMLLFNRVVSREPISPNENEALIREYNEARDARLKKARDEADSRDQEKIKKAEDNADVLAAQKLVENADEEEDNIVTKVTPGISVNPLGVLFPYQLLMGQAISSLRVIKRVVLWDESYVAFWITSACIVLGVALLWVPWTFIIHWTSRIVVWTCLGPWMKLADIFYFRKRENMTRKERREELREKVKVLRKKSLERAKLAQIKKENVMKGKAMASFLYGEYITAPPRHKQTRYFDTPLETSSAEPYVFDRDYRHDVVKKIHGQDMDGDMIPLPQEEYGFPSVDRYADLQKRKGFRAETKEDSTDST